MPFPTAFSTTFSTRFSTVYSTDIPLGTRRVRDAAWTSRIRRLSQDKPIEAAAAAHTAKILTPDPTMPPPTCHDALMYAQADNNNKGERERERETALFLLMIQKEHLFNLLLLLFLFILVSVSVSFAVVVSVVCCLLSFAQKLNFCFAILRHFLSSSQSSVSPQKRQHKKRRSWRERNEKLSHRCETWVSQCQVCVRVCVWGVCV